MIELATIPSPETDVPRHEELIGKVSLMEPLVDTPKVEAATLGPDEVVAVIEGLKNHNFARLAPVFSEQIKDTSRTNPIEYVHGTRHRLGTDTNNFPSMSVSEFESINALDQFLLEVTEGTEEDYLENLQARSMRENLTFIGKKEYDEATAGIAEYWKDLLRSNSQSQLLAVTGEIDSIMVKSDAYLLDNILKHFSDDELAEFKDRLVTHPFQLSADPKDVQVVLIDDWTISGQQMKDAVANFVDEYPQYKNRVQIQLVAATEDRIKYGLHVYLRDGKEWNSTSTTSVPVKAYYMANEAMDGAAIKSGAHITGAHCAVDFDFNNDISRMAAAILTDMPPATNIVRPYRKPGVVLEQVNRLQISQTTPWQRAKVNAQKNYYSDDFDDDDYYGSDED